MSRYETDRIGNRVMLEQLERARRRGRVLLLDPGSATLAGAVVWWDKEAERHGASVRTHLAGVSSIPSRGLGAHGVSDMREFRRALRDLVNQVEGSARRGAVDEVLVSLQSRSLLCHHARGDARISGGIVADRDILRALRRCARPPGGMERSILHAIPVQFSIDDKDGILDPRELAGDSIIADILWSTVPRPALREIALCVEACGLKPAGFVAAPFASGFACSDPRHRNTGFACVDLGASATGVSVFLCGKCIHCSALPVGGGGIVARIANETGLDLDEAERFRRGEGEAPEEISRIVETALVRLFEQVRDLLVEEEFYQMPGREVYLGGGGGKDPRAHGIAARVLACPVSPVRARSVWWPSERAADPAFIGLQGLARFARETPPDLRQLEHALTGSVVGFVRRTAHWISENW